MEDKFETDALRIGRTIGIPEEELKVVLEELLKIYNGNWTLIAEDNYKTLFDSYFENNQDNKSSSLQKHDNKKSRGLEGHGGTSVRQKKRMIVGGKQRNSVMIDLSKNSYHEESKIPPQNPSRKIEKSSQPRASDSRSISRALVPVQTDIKKEARSSFDASSQDRKSVSFIGTSSSEPCSSVPLLENGPSKLQARGFPRSRSDGQINDLSISKKPVPTSRLGHSVGDMNGQGSSSSDHRSLATLDQKRTVNYIDDITKGTEKIKIPLVIEVSGSESLPKFNYIPENIICEHATINISLNRISGEECCSSCSGDCLSRIPCACARDTGGEYAYTSNGLLKKKFLKACLAIKENPHLDNFFFCKECPLEKIRNDYNPGKCKGHVIRKFIKECWRKCGCDMKCGNRVVQRGISCKLQVFLTREGKGWGLRPLEALPRGTFVCEYIGEVLTNSELFKRNMEVSKDRHTYPVTLDADWGSEGILKDEEALCLDATFNGNVARFINHRCSDANLVDIPVSVETPDRHYYHLAFFTTRDVSAKEELNWDYGIDFEDVNHPIEAFRCCCGSLRCRG